jgi:hypothetical protein
MSSLSAHTRMILASGSRALRTEEEGRGGLCYRISLRLAGYICDCGVAQRTLHSYSFALSGFHVLRWFPTTNSLPVSISVIYHRSSS